MRTIVFFFILASFSSFGILSSAKNLDKKKIEKYKKQGISYAIELHNPNGTHEEYQDRNRKADIFAHKLRSKAIKKSLQFLKQSNDKATKHKLLKHLAHLYDKHAIAENSLFPKKRRSKKFTSRSILIRENLLKKNLQIKDKISIMAALAENYISIGNENKAKPLYETIVRKYPRSKFTDDAMLALGNINYNKNNFSKARFYYNNILKLKDKSLYIYASYKIAWTYFNERKIKLALAKLVTVIQLGQKVRKNGKIDITEEATRDLVLFYSEAGSVKNAKSFFLNILGREKAMKALYRLTRKYFDYDNHSAAKAIAHSLLQEDIPDLYRKDLLMINLHIFEKTGDIKNSIRYATRLGSWTKKIQVKYKNNMNEDIKIALKNIEETIRSLFSHTYYNAKKENKESQYKLAIRAYEVYKNSFKKSNLSADVYYHYANFLRRKKEHLKAYKVANKLIKEFDPKDKRFRNILKLRIQVIEEASKNEKIILSNKRLIAAYDSFIRHYPKDTLSQHALFKSAQLLEKEGQQEQAASRYEKLIKEYPSSKLRKLAALNMMKALSKVKSWNELEKKAFSVAKHAEKLSQDRKIASIMGLSILAVAESYEKNKEYERVKELYVRFIKLRKESKLRITAYIKLLNMLENKLGYYEEAIDYWKKFRKDYPNEKISKNALLEEARIYEKFMRPKKAIKAYLKYAEKGNSKLHISALSNASILMESVGKWENAANNFLELYNRLPKHDKSKNLEALQASCTNQLLTIGKKGKNNDRLEKLLNCSTLLSKQSPEPMSSIWKLRIAWSLKNLGKKIEAFKYWKEVIKAKKNLLKIDAYQPFLALSFQNFLEIEAKKFNNIKFSKDSDKNKVLKSKMEKLNKIENLTANIINHGTESQARTAAQTLYDVYLSLSEELTDDSILPKNLSKKERQLIKQGFHKVANKLEEKANNLILDRQLASTADAQELETKEKTYPSMDKKDFQYYLLRAANHEDIQAYARLAWHYFDKGKIDIARFIYLKWGQAITKMGKKLKNKKTVLAHKEFGEQIRLKIPEKDPIVMELI